MRTPRRWIVRGLLAVLLIFAIIIGGVFYDRYRTSSAGQKRYTAITAELDARDPRWRLDEIEADRPNIPERENAASLISGFQAATNGRKFELRRADGEYVLLGDQPNRYLGSEDLDIIAELLRQFEGPLGVARSFERYSRGQLRVRFREDTTIENLNEVTELRQLFEILKYDAVDLCRQRKPNDALRSARTILHVTRVADGDTCMMAALIRIAGDAIAITSINRCLALSEPTVGLDLAQNALLREAESPFLWRAFRGERAGCDAIFAHINDGKIMLTDLMNEKVGSRGLTKPNVEERAAEWQMRPHLNMERANCLEFASAAIAVRMLPEDQQLLAMHSIPVPPKTNGGWTANLISKAYIRVFEAGLRIRAQLRCAVVGVAVERFRQTYARWPTSLAEIPKQILPSIPNDPYDGLHVKLAQCGNGVVVYSVGADGQDNKGHYPDRARPNDSGTDLVFRLYDIDQRGKPPLPLSRMDWELLPEDEDESVFQLPLQGPMPREIRN